MECLDNTVGSRFNCNSETFTYYVEDLAGYDPSTIDDIVSGAYKDTQHFLDTKISIAKQQILEEVRGFIKPNIRSRSVLETDTVGWFQENRTIKAATAGSYRGVNIRANGSQYYAAHINSITVYLSNSGAVNVLIYDVLTGQLKDTIAVTAVANVPTEVVVNKTYASKKQRLSLAVLIDTNNASYNTTVWPSGNTCFTCERGWYKSNHYTEARAVEIAQATSIMERNLTGATHTNGLSVNYTLNCNMENFICTIASSLAGAIWYRVGMEIALHCVHNFSRFNGTANRNIDDFKRLQMEYGQLYDARMKWIFDNMIWPSDNVCFVCSERISTKVMLP